MADEARSNPRAAGSREDAVREEAMRWFAEWHDPLRRYLLCAGASVADANDAAQETFLRLQQHLANGGEQSNMRGWIFQVARNYLRDEHKSARRRKSTPIEGAELMDAAIDPERAAITEERERRVRAAVAKLPEPQRECILLRSAGLRYREIAEVMGVNISSVGTMVARAVARLSEDLA